MNENDLSEDEREFLRGYRNSSPEQKKRVQQMAMRLATKRINEEFRNPTASRAPRRQTG